MNILEAILLGILQGITEFLPISSSGHLVVVESLLGLEVEGLKDFDIALHVATLLAILIYFHRDLSKTKWWPWLILASVPAALVGFTLEDQIDAVFRNTRSVGIFMLIMGALFMIPQRQENKPLTWWRALLLGCAQGLAIIPGVSRSGSTIFTGMQLGMKREEAARFSFLLGAIAIAGAGLLKALDTETLELSWPVLSVGFVSSFVSSLVAVSWLMKFLKNHTFKIFGWYRIIFGIIILFLGFVSAPANSAQSLTLIAPMDWDGEQLWKYDNPSIHHDFLELPSGNMLFTFWEPYEGESQKNFWADTLMEWDPDSEEIVWEWYAQEDLDLEQEKRGEGGPDLTQPKDLGVSSTR